MVELKIFRRPNDERSSRAEAGSTAAMQVKKRILVVDDDAAVRSTLRRALTDRYEVELVDSPSAALERFKQGGIDLVITDRQMPGMDGYELTKAIIAHDKDAKVIMLTGNANEDNRRDAYKAGCVGAFFKPFSPDTLQGMVAAVLQRDGLTEPPMGVILHVLIVDDTEDTKPVAATALYMAGHKPILAERRTDAIAAIRGDENIFTVIVRYGMEELDRILHDIKILKSDMTIIILAKENELEFAKTLEGIAAVIVKPVDHKTWEKAVLETL